MAPVTVTVYYGGTTTKGAPMEFESVRVFNLATGAFGPIYHGITPRQAVIAAHAQSLGNWNTWTYEDTYGSEVVEGGITVRCGDFTARTDAPTGTAVEHLASQSVVSERLAQMDPDERWYALHDGWVD